LNWDAIGAVAEAIGAAGVIASLLYLAVQVRGSTRASAVEAKLHSTGLLHNFIDSLIETPELNDLYLRGLADLDSLSEVEYYRFSNLSLKAFWFFSAAHFQFRMGTLGEDDWHEVRAVIHYWLRRRSGTDRSVRNSGSSLVARSPLWTPPNKALQLAWHFWHRNSVVAGGAFPRAGS
jgi:hypothetical protein